MKKRIKIFLGLITILTLSIGAICYKVGIGFGKATVQTVEAVEDLKADLKKKNINPIDTIMKQKKRVLDSLNSNKK